VAELKGPSRVVEEAGPGQLKERSICHGHRAPVKAIDGTRNTACIAPSVLAMEKLGRSRGLRMRVQWEQPPPSTARLRMATWMIDTGRTLQQGGDGPLMRAGAQRLSMR